MPDIDAFQLISWAAFWTVALVSGTLGVLMARFGHRYNARSVVRLVVVFSAAATVHWLAVGIAALVPAPQWGTWPTWLIVLCIVQEWALLVAVSTSHQFAVLAAHPRARLRPAWFVANYSPAVVLGVFVATIPRILPGTPDQQLMVYSTIRSLALLTWLGLNVAVLRVGALRPGRWRPGFAANGPLHRDWMLYAAGLAFAVVSAPVAMLSGNRWLGLATIVVVATLLTLPLTARIGGQAVRAFGTAAGMLLVMGGTFLAVRALARPLADAGMSRLADLMVIVALAAVGVAARPWLQRGLDRVLLGRQRRRWAELEAQVRTLPAEDGVHACCSAYVETAMRILGVDGVAVVLDDGFVAAAGCLDGAEIGRVWARVGARGSLGAARRAADLPADVVEGLTAADVSAVAEIASARRRWGHVFSSTSPVARSYGPEEEHAGDSVAAQLALMLDAAALVERAVAVERSLAEAEKLAAVGETAARIAHEIRNPVTAARSLAQLLVRRPDSPRGPEQAALILEELERVEQQVAALLRFARRETFRFGPVELDRLARTTLDGLGARLADAGVSVTVDAPAVVVAVGDGEKLRQVLVNLVENAIDAMRDQTAPRQLVVTVDRQDGLARLRVADSGAGIAAEVLPRVFEPFFTAKPQGTGLGLAIAKHTIDAHGGCLRLGAIGSRGTVATVELPAAPPLEAAS